MKARNLYLSLAVALTAALCVSCGCKPRKVVGLQLYSIREDLSNDLSGSLDSVAKIGYTFVEAANYGDGKFYGMDPVEFKNLVESKGLKFISSHIGSALPDSSSWDEVMAWWDETIAAHKAAGVQYLIFPWIDWNDLQSPEKVQRYCDLFNAVGAKCKEAGIVFGFHNHDGEFSNQIDGMPVFDYMMAHTNPEDVFFQLDVYWATMGGVQPADYLKKYAGRYKLLHIKDVKEIGASGKVDFKAVYDVAEQAGVEYCVVEHEAFDYPHFESLQKSFDYLNNADFVKPAYAGACTK